MSAKTSAGAEKWLEEEGNEWRVEWASLFSECGRKRNSPPLLSFFPYESSFCSLHLTKAET